MVLGIVLNDALHNEDRNDDDDDGDDGSLYFLVFMWRAWARFRAEKIDNNDGDNGCSIFEKESFVLSSMEVIMWPFVV